MTAKICVVIGGGKGMGGAIAKEMHKPKLQAGSYVSIREL